MLLLPDLGSLCRLRSLSMTGAARVVGDAAKAAAASPEDERTQAAYEEEFEEESVRYSDGHTDTDTTGMRTLLHCAQDEPGAID